MTRLNYQTENNNFERQLALYNQSLPQHSAETTSLIAGWQPPIEIDTEAAWNQRQASQPTAGLMSAAGINNSDDERQPVGTRAISAETTPPTTAPEILLKKYQYLVYVTDSLKVAAPAGCWARRKFNSRRDALLIAAERSKTALLQWLFRNMLAELAAENQEELLKGVATQSWLRKTITFLLWLSTVIYGGFKGFSALAGVLSAFLSVKSVALIASSTASAALFCLMLMLFEGREVCNARGGLFADLSSTRAQMGEQYQIVRAMQSTVLSETTAENSVARKNTLQSYSTVIAEIHDIDLSKKIKLANDYKNTPKTKSRKGVEISCGLLLGILNGASFGFVGISTISLMTKIALGALLATAISTPAGAGALAAFLLLFIAGFAVAWYVKKLGESLTKAISNHQVLLDIAEKENADRGTNSLQTKIKTTRGFFANPIENVADSLEITTQSRLQIK